MQFMISSGRIITDNDDGGGGGGGESTDTSSVELFQLLIHVKGDL